MLMQLVVKNTHYPSLESSLHIIISRSATAQKLKHQKELPVRFNDLFEWFNCIHRKMSWALGLFQLYLYRLQIKHTILIPFQMYLHRLQIKHTILRPFQMYLYRRRIKHTIFTLFHLYLYRLRVKHAILTPFQLYLHRLRIKPIIATLFQRVYEIDTQKNGIFTQTQYIFLKQ